MMATEETLAALKTLIAAGITVTVGNEITVDIDASDLLKASQMAATVGVKAAAASPSFAKCTEDAAKDPALGRAAAAASKPVVLSTEDAAKVPALGAAAAAASTPVVQCTEDAARQPASLGSKADAASFPVTQSTEDKAALAALLAKFPAVGTQKVFYAALGNSFVAIAAAGRIFGGVFSMLSTHISAQRYLLIIDAASLPANGDVSAALLCSPIPFYHFAGSQTDIDLAKYIGAAGVRGATGVVVAVSSTLATLTIETEAAACQLAGCAVLAG